MISKALLLLIASKFAFGGLPVPTLGISRPSTAVGPQTNQVCRYILSIADCSWNVFTSVPLPNSMGQTTLLLDHNRIKTLESLASWKSSGLKSIDLSSNGMKTISEGAFNEMTNLVYLDLSNNHLETLPKKIFTGVTLLVGLSLRYNRLTSIEVDFFQLTKLVTLFLDNNQFTTVPTAIASLTTIQRLTLNDNRLTSNTIDLPVGLVYLDVSGGLFSTIKSPFSRLSLLQTLILGQPALVVDTEILLGCASLTTLEMVNLGTTTYPNIYPLADKLTSLHLTNSSTLTKITLPANLTTLELDNLQNFKTFPALPPSLSAVTITNCPLLSISFSYFSNLPLLKTVNLANSVVTDFSSKGGALFQTTSINTVIIQYANLTQFEASLYSPNNMDHVQTLNLKGNAITDLKTPQVQYLSSLTNLTISYNKLTLLSLSRFRLNGRLTHIDASFNLIETVIVADLSTGIPTHLNLAGNRIKHIDPSYLQGLTALTILDLSANLISNFTMFTNVSSSSLKVVSNSNPWSCNCANINSFRTLPKTASFVCASSSGISVTPCVICQSPDSVAGRSIGNVTCNDLRQTTTAMTVTSYPTTVFHTTTAYRPTNATAFATTSVQGALTQEQTYIIAGVSSGFVFLLMALLVCFVVYRKTHRKFRRASIIPSHRPKSMFPRKGKRQVENANPQFEGNDKISPYMETQNGEIKGGETISDKAFSKKSQHPQPSAPSLPEYDDTAVDTKPVIGANGASIYDGDYIVMPAGQSIPEGNKGSIESRSHSQQRAEAVKADAKTTHVNGVKGGSVYDGDYIVAQAGQSIPVGEVTPRVAQLRGTTDGDGYLEVRTSRPNSKPRSTMAFGDLMQSVFEARPNYMNTSDDDDEEPNNDQWVYENDA